MARLASEAKLGFYPASPLAVQEILRHLYCRLPDPEKSRLTSNILDPCCGQGAALGQLQHGLQILPENTYGIELDAGRADGARAANPGANILGPASFLNVQVSAASFGLTYVNPPFSDELGGGRREEQAFCQQATRLLVPKGIMVLVCPHRAMCGNRSFVEFFDSHFVDVAVYKFPDGEDEEGRPIRPFHEIVVFGKKRATAIPTEKLDEFGTLHRMDMQYGYARNDPASLPALGQPQPKGWHDGTPSSEREADIRRWEVPLAWRPNTFRKTMFTESELIGLLAESPLNRILEEVTIPPPKAPPLPLDKGHLGLLLASGMLDGVVEGPFGVHVVRGSSSKVEYHNKAESGSTQDAETGAVTTRDVYSQRMVTTIRVVESNGDIKTFSNHGDVEQEDDQ